MVGWPQPTAEHPPSLPVTLLSHRMERKARRFKAMTICNTGFFQQSSWMSLHEHLVSKPFFFISGSGQTTYYWQEWQQIITGKATSDTNITQWQILSYLAVRKFCSRNYLFLFYSEKILYMKCGFANIFFLFLCKLMVL